MALSAKASYKKLSGVVQLTDTHLQWTQDGKGAPSVRVPHSQAACESRQFCRLFHRPSSCVLTRPALFCSREGAARVALKLTLVDDPTGAGYNFTFTAPQRVAVSEREAFKTELTNIIARNRNGGPPTPQAPPLALPTAAIARNGTKQPARPVLAAASARPSVTPLSRASSVAADPRTPMSPTPFGSDPAADFRLRKKVLVANPELASLHKELVMSGQISELDFWEGRGVRSLAAVGTMNFQTELDLTQHLLAAQAAFEAQRKGRPGQLVDPRPETVDGEIKIVITPQLVHDIFEEYPVVAKAYSENVPNEVFSHSPAYKFGANLLDALLHQLMEAEFWKRYFQSKLFNAHRASIRSAAAQHVVRDDPIFDKYLEKDDDGAYAMCTSSFQPQTSWGS